MTYFKMVLTIVFCFKVDYCFTVLSYMASYTLSNMTSFKRFESKPVVKIIYIYTHCNLWRHRLSLTRTNIIHMSTSVSRRLNNKYNVFKIIACLIITLFAGRLFVMVGCLQTCRKHLHVHILLLWGGRGGGMKLPYHFFFYWNAYIKRSCICVWGVSILHFSTILLLDFGTAPTMWYFLFSISVIECRWSWIVRLDTFSDVTTLKTLINSTKTVYDFLLRYLMITSLVCMSRSSTSLF